MHLQVDVSQHKFTQYDEAMQQAISLQGLCNVLRSKENKSGIEKQCRMSCLIVASLFNLLSLLGFFHLQMKMPVAAT